MVGFLLNETKEKASVSGCSSGGCFYHEKWRPVRESNPSCQDENLES